MTVFDWHAYLTLADELLDQVPHALTPAAAEAARRTAISRAYYAAFCLARDHLRAQGIVIPAGGRAHDAVWSTFHGLHGAIHRRIADRGRRLKRRRGRADYDATYPALDSDARLAVALGRQLAADIAALP